ncbi:MAG: hypothetical protein ACKVJX_21770 [Verrucomicrobiia bacterium]|jgi:hypothetical protein|tara:strand:+ start:279 stop:671 length:393 start_codon:yes stop_codon:yes gene_type:complete
MKKLFTILLSAALMIGLAAPLTAAEGKKAKSEKTEKPKKKKRNTFPYYGAIGKIDEKANTFTIVGKSSTRTFHLTAQAKITRDGKQAKLADFKAKDQVSGSCKKAPDKGEGHYTVMSMKPRPAKKAKKKK